MRDRRLKRQVGKVIGAPEIRKGGAAEIRQGERGRLQAFCTGPSVGSGTHLLPLPVDAAERMPCDAEARREALGGVCSDFRNSKRFHSGIGYLPVQRVRSYLI